MVQKGLFIGVLFALAGCAAAPVAVTPVAETPVAAVPQAPAFDGNFDALLERADHLLTLTDGQPVRIENAYGDVRLRFGGYQHVLEVHVVAQRPDRSRPAFVAAPVAGAEGVSIVPRLADGSTPMAGERIDLSVFVPLGHPTTVRTTTGLIESRGSKNDLDLASEYGGIQVRGNSGLLMAHSGSGQIEVAFEDAAPGSKQALSTVSGTIIAAFADSNNLDLDVQTSAPIATEYSLDIERLTGAEPNKRARAAVGQPGAHLSIHSKRGEVRLLRRAEFTPVAVASP